MKQEFWKSNKSRSLVRVSPLFAAMCIAAFLAWAYTDRAAVATHSGPHPAIFFEPLTERAEFTDDVAVQIRNKFPGRGTDVINLRDASRVMTALITVEPEAIFPWHTHPGPVVVTVAEGEIIYMLAEDCVERLYQANEAFVDAGFDNVHTGFNPSATEDAVLVATFLGLPDEGPPTIVVAGPDLSIFCP